MPNLAYEVAVRGKILPPQEDFTPYAITLSRSSPTVNYTALRRIGVSIAVFEAGYLFDSIHIKQNRYRNPHLSKQIELAQENNIPFGLYAEVRARTISEAKQELKELALVVRRYSPQVGVWLKLFFNNSRTTNNQILNTYYTYLTEKLGLKDQLGLYVTRSQLSRITWDDYYEKFYLWLIDHVSSIDNLDELLTPQFFMTETT